MTSNAKSGVPISVEAGYPDLLRMGHRFETSVGQRKAFDGLRAPTNLAFGGGGCFFTLNRQNFDAVVYENIPQVTKARFLVCNIEDELQRNISPLIDGKSQGFSVGFRHRMDFAILKLKKLARAGICAEW